MKYKHISSTYKVKNYITLDILMDYGFRKSFSREITYRFPVYKYEGKPILFAEMLYNADEHQVHINVNDTSGNSYSYNKEEYGKSKVIEEINFEINKKINKMVKEWIIKEEKKNAH